MILIIEDSRGQGRLVISLPVFPLPHTLSRSVPCVPPHGISCLPTEYYFPINRNTPYTLHYALRLLVYPASHSTATHKEPSPPFFYGFVLFRSVRHHMSFLSCPP